MLTGWTTDHIAVVTSAGCLSAVGSVALFANVERVRRSRVGCISKIYGGVCSGLLGGLAGIVAALCLIETFPQRPLLVVGVSVALAMACEVGTRAGWRVLVRLGLAIVQNSLRALMDERSGTKDSDNET